MSTLFLLGCVDSSVLRSSGLLDDDTVFDREVNLPDVDSLLVNLYRDRLDIGDRWNYESGVSLVIYNEKSVYKMDLNNILKRFFPCFNICAIDSEDTDSISKFCIDVQEDIEKCTDRIKRMSYWMYHRPSGQCSSRIYSMMEQLMYVKLEHSNNSSRMSIPRALRNINFESIVRENIKKDDSYYWDKLSTWAFQPHHLKYDELIYSSFLLLKKLSDAANIAISSNKLLLLILTLEASYHKVNKFHNFKHAADVMQATWQLCEKLIDDPLQVLLLCIAAIGHDIGHPGSNNQLLCKYNSPVAENYQNNSVLENMHNDLLRDVLSQQWPQLLSINHSKKYNKTNINILSEAIRATDMALHEGYVKKLEHAPKNDVIDFPTLLTLIIKAADISNVTRPLQISSQWACLITFEFTECSHLQDYEENKEYDVQADLECKDVFLLTPDELVSRYPSIPNGQVFFIETFAEQFFTEFCTKLPGLNFLIDNMQKNKEFWLTKKQ